MKQHQYYVILKKNNFTINMENKELKMEEVAVVAHLIFLNKCLVEVVRVKSKELRKLNLN